MKKKKFIYLVQGKKENVQKFSFLQTEISDLITLTFDYDFNNDINWLKNLYLPKSTWAEGRNLQLEYASNLNIDYLYYIFLDDDTKMIKGTFNHFEELLIKYEPAVGLPLCDIVKNNLFFLNSKKGSPKKNKINFYITRKGNTIGKHSINFENKIENIELKHTAFSRELFADGALKAAIWISKKNKGLFDMQDMLNLK